MCVCDFVYVNSHCKVTEGSHTAMQSCIPPPPPNVLFCHQESTVIETMCQKLKDSQTRVGEMAHENRYTYRLHHLHSAHFC